MTRAWTEELPFMFELGRGCCWERLSMGSVLARIIELGPREKFCVPGNPAPSEYCNVGNPVKLDGAGEVARRRGIGAGTGCPVEPYILVSMVRMGTLWGRSTAIHLPPRLEGFSASWLFWSGVRVFDRCSQYCRTSRCTAPFAHSGY